MLNDFSNAYKEFWIKATDFKGFTSRSDWWLVQLANLIISSLTWLTLRTLKEGRKALTEINKDRS